jgi:NADP-dependent 3-hydroxy acid dehydrogenase YdfG
MKDFKQKTAVITGAGSGFGREFARKGAALGMNLVLADVQKDALMAVADELTAKGAKVIAEVIDVSKGEQVDALAAAAKKAFGNVHLLFNNAGVAAGGLMWEHTQADWEWVLGDSRRACFRSGHVGPRRGRACSEHRISRRLAFRTDNGCL